MITKSEHASYSAHSDADYTDDDRKAGRVAFADALKTATNNDDRRVLSAEHAFTNAAHYERLAQFDGLDEYSRDSAIANSDFCRLRGTLLLSECTDGQIADACSKLLRKAAAQ